MGRVPIELPNDFRHRTHEQAGVVRNNPHFGAYCAFCLETCDSVDVLVVMLLEQANDILLDRGAMTEGGEILGERDPNVRNVLVLGHSIDRELACTTGVDHLVIHAKKEQSKHDKYGTRFTGHSAMGRL